MRIDHAVPVLEVTDVEASITWYREMLGFAADPFPAEPPFEFAILRRDTAELMLRRVAELDAIPNRTSGTCTSGTGGQLRERHAQLAARSMVTRRLERMFYGLAEFEITDPDGNVVCLSEELADTSDLPTPL